MSDAPVAPQSSPAVAAPSPPKKVKGATAKQPRKPKRAPTHPKVADMVTSAIADLKERNGSSLQAIKKHIAAAHKVDVDKLAPFIKKHLKAAVASGALIQTKGKGASGSFKLNATSATKKKPVAAPSAKKATKQPKKKASKAATPSKKAAVSKPKTSPKKAEKKPKKSVAAAAVAAVKKPTKALKSPKRVSAPKKVKTPKKEKKAKAPIKPKSPKPKKAAAGRKKAAPRK